jgi:hypothetical protein
MGEQLGNHWVWAKCVQNENATINLYTYEVAEPSCDDEPHDRSTH